jgi:hypothetical protein
VLRGFEVLQEPKGGNMDFNVHRISRSAYDENIERPSENACAVSNGKTD